jgi:pimeloyl-ACP methyl ester carboxylesterase
MRKFFKFILIVALAYVVLSLLVAVPFSNILIKPHARHSLLEAEAEKLRKQWIAEKNLQVDVLSIISDAGPKLIKLSGWWIFRNSANNKPTVIFLAGNGGMNPKGFEDKVMFLIESGFNCFLLDQRGYGDSAGELLSHGYYERQDFTSVENRLKNRYGIDKDRIALWGISMGATNAVMIASAHPEIKALLLYAPWSDPFAMAVHYIGLTYSIPKFLLHFPIWSAIKIGGWRTEAELLDPAEEAKKIHCPVVVVRGDADDIVPPELTDRLFKSLAGPKQLVVIAGAHHNDLLEVIGSEKYLAQMKQVYSPLIRNQNR